MQCSDLSSTISGILILQYVLEMRNITSLGLDGGTASEIPYSSSSLPRIHRCQQEWQLWGKAFYLEMKQR